MNGLTERQLWSKGYAMSRFKMADSRIWGLPDAREVKLAEGLVPVDLIEGVEVTRIDDIFKAVFTTGARIERV